MKENIVKQPLISKVKIDGPTTEVEIVNTVDWEKVPCPHREEYSEAGKTKKQWDKIDKKELKKDSKKEKKEHEKDAVKDDESKVKKDKKGKQTEKKRVEEHDLKKDEKFDKEDGAAEKKKKGNLPPWLNKKGDDDSDDKDSDKKNGDKKSDKKDSKKEDEKKSKKAKADYNEYWHHAAERFGGEKRSKLKDSDFLDPTRRSFPVVSCKNVKAAVSTWGMYKGDMSFESFKSKLKSRAKKLGCEGSIPKSWKKE